MDIALKDLGAPPTLAPPIRRSVSGRQYSCSVTHAGVQFGDIANGNTKYEADINGYLPLLTPKLTQAGKVAVGQPHIPTQLAKWWKAQCEFRGLSSAGTIRDIQDRIREHGDAGLSKTTKEARKKMVREYVEENNRAIEELWVRADNNEKAKIWLKRFLYESLVVNSGSSKETVMLNVDDWGNNIEEVSRQKKIFCEMRKMPDYETGQRLVIIGLNQLSVRSQMTEVDRGIQRSILRARREEELKEREAKVEFDRRLSLAQSKGKRSNTEWNVSGKWNIRCPNIEAIWGSGEDGCSLKIGFTEPTETGLVQIAPKHAQFLLPATSLPSSSAREFSYRWRGEETGENMIELGSDLNVCSITFESSNALSGIFISDYTGEVGFTGFRDGFEAETKGLQPQGGRLAMDRLDPSYEWSSRNEAAYERARVGRWRR